MSERVLFCQYCGRTNVPGGFARIHQGGTVRPDGTVDALGPVTDAYFVCDVCSEQMWQDHLAEEAYAEIGECEGSA